MNAARRPRLVVFDWDGTLVDSAERIVAACQAAVRECGLPPPPAASVRELIGLGLEQTFAVLLPDVTVHDRTRAVARYRELWALGAAQPTPTFEGVHETLSVLAADGILLGVATGKSRRGLDRELRLHGLDGLFAATRCADEAPSKPHPAMLQSLLEELQVAPAQALMVGDTEYDMAMAQAASVAAVAVRCGVHDETRLARFAPRGVIDRVRDLPSWMGMGGAGRGATAHERD